MNHKAFSLLFITFFVFIFCLSSTNSRRLSEGNVPYDPLHKEPICKKYILGKCIATKKPPISLKPAPRASKPCIPALKNCNGKP
ncbi:hypothetical protein P3S68_032980 [Capsicum galapagoense]